MESIKDNDDDEPVVVFQKIRFINSLTTSPHHFDSQPAVNPPGEHVEGCVFKNLHECTCQAILSLQEKYKKFVKSPTSSFLLTPSSSGNSASLSNGSSCSSTCGNYNIQITPSTQSSSAANKSQDDSEISNENETNLITRTYKSSKKTSATKKIFKDKSILKKIAGKNQEDTFEFDTTTSSNDSTHYQSFFIPENDNESSSSFTMDSFLRQMILEKNTSLADQQEILSKDKSIFYSHVTQYYSKSPRNFVDQLVTIIEEATIQESTFDSGDFHRYIDEESEPSELLGESRETTFDISQPLRVRKILASSSQTSNHDQKEEEEKERNVNFSTPKKSTQKKKRTIYRKTPRRHSIGNSLSIYRLNLQDDGDEKEEEEASKTPARGTRLQSLDEICEEKEESIPKTPPPDSFTYYERVCEKSATPKIKKILMPIMRRSKSSPNVNKALADREEILKKYREQLKSLDDSICGVEKKNDDGILYETYDSHGHHCPSSESQDHLVCDLAFSDEDDQSKLVMIELAKKRKNCLEATELLFENKSDNQSSSSSNDESTFDIDKMKELSIILIQVKNYLNYLIKNHPIIRGVLMNKKTNVSDSGVGSWESSKSRGSRGRNGKNKVEASTTDGRLTLRSVSARSASFSSSGKKPQKKSTTLLSCRLKSPGRRRSVSPIGTFTSKTSLRIPTATITSRNLRINKTPGAKKSVSPRIVITAPNSSAAISSRSSIVSGSPGFFGTSSAQKKNQTPQPTRRFFITPSNKSKKPTTTTTTTTSIGQNKPRTFFTSYGVCSNKIKSPVGEYIRGKSARVSFKETSSTLKSGRKEDGISTVSNQKE